MKQVFDVQGMSCNHCAKAVTQAVQQLDPLAQVQVDLTGKKVEVDSAQPREAIAKAIADEGYAVAA
ncbi:MAG: heavy-metal-associated domain-containing protein [Limnohabitans sp.]